MRSDMEYPTIGLMSIVITESLMTMALFVNIESFLTVSLVLLVNLAQLHPPLLQPAYQPALFILIQACERPGQQLQGNRTPPRVVTA